MRKGNLYKITNKVNDKLYIGKTYKTIEKRFREHISRSKSETYKNYPLYLAMNKYGQDSFYIELIDVFEEGKLEEMEEHYIRLYDTYGKNGYNGSYGGEGYRKLPYTDEEIIKVYNEEKTLVKSSKRLGCSTQAIHDVLNKHNIRSNNFNKVSIDEIADKYNELKDIGEVAKYFDYCKDTIRHKLDLLGVNFRREKVDISGILDKYNNGSLVKDIAKELHTSSQTVSSILKDNDIIASRLYKDKLNKEDVIRYYLETKSLIKTANKFNVERKTLSEYLKENGVDVISVSKNTPVKIAMVLDEENIEFNSMLECANFMIENNLTKNKCARGIRDNISKAIKNKNTYLGYKFYKIN